MNIKNIGYINIIILKSILATLVVCYPAILYADWGCDPEKNLFRIAPTETQNQAADRSEKECVFSNGRTVRVRLGVGPAYPYGEGGGDPDRWLSIWVDKKKVVSKFIYYTFWSCGRASEPECDLFFEVDSHGYKLCVANKEGSYTCETTTNDKFPKDIDLLEYPTTPANSPPAAGSLVTLFAKDKQFCSLFQVQSQPQGRPGDNIWPNIIIPDTSEAVAEKASFMYEYAGEYKQYIFDINNDGKIDTVVALHARTHYRDGDVYFVYSGTALPQPDVEKVGSTHSELEYAKAAKRILPHYWSDYTGKDEKLLAEKDLDDGAYKVKSSTVPWWDTDDKPVFTFRYWYLWPFRYKNTTYFLTWSQEADKQHWYLILRPEPNYQVTEICVFQVVQMRY